MTGRFHLIPHIHSGQLKSHGHTSYPGLLFLLIMTGVLVLGASIGAQGAVQNPQSGSLGLSGTVPGPAPTQAAVITSPRDGDVTSSSPITVSGSCPNGTFVFVDKNSVLAGEAACDNGSFSLQIDLFDGSNVLVARVVDGLGQYGPDSTPVNVTYNMPTTVLNNGASGKQLFLETDATVVAGEPNTSLARSVTIVGGDAPYAVSWDFGDGGTNLMTVAQDGLISATHTYTSPGTYKVTVRVSDADGNAAFIQLVTVINGPVAAVTGSGQSNANLPGKLLLVWPLLIFAFTLVLAFWLGERRITRRDQRRQRLAPV